MRRGPGPAAFWPAPLYNTRLICFNIIGRPGEADYERAAASGKGYLASYFGEVDISSWSEDYTSREFWRLEGAGSEFDGLETTNWLPETNYPMDIALGQVFVIEYHLVGDGTRQVVTRCVGGSMDYVGQDLGLITFELDLL